MQIIDTFLKNRKHANDQMDSLNDKLFKTFGHSPIYRAWGVIVIIGFSFVFSCIITFVLSILLSAFGLFSPTVFWILAALFTFMIARKPIGNFWAK